MKKWLLIITLIFLTAFALIAEENLFEDVEGTVLTEVEGGQYPGDRGLGGRNAVREAKGAAMDRA